MPLNKRSSVLKNSFEPNENTFVTLTAAEQRPDGKWDITVTFDEGEEKSGICKVAQGFEPQVGERVLMRRNMFNELFILPNYPQPRNGHRPR